MQTKTTDTTTPEERAELRRICALGYGMPPETQAIVLALLDERDALAAEQSRHLPRGLMLEYGRLDAMWQALVIERDDAKRRIAELEAREPEVCPNGECIDGRIAQRLNGLVCGTAPCPTCAPLGGRGAVWRAR